MVGKHFTFIIISGLLMLAAVSGCGKDESGVPQLSSQANERDFEEIHKNVNLGQETKAVATSGSDHGMGFVHGKKEKPDPNKIIASVNDEKILRKDLDKILDRFRKQVPPGAIPSLEKQIAEQLVTQAILRQFVQEKGLDVADDVVNNEINKMRENIAKNPAAEGKTLEQFLEIQGSNIDELRTAIRMSAALDAYVTNNVDDKTLENYFIKNINEFTGEEVTASHILIGTKGMEEQEDLDKARAKIESIKKELDNGANFAELAKKYSECPTGKTGGELGSFPRHGAMVETFANAAFSTEVGKVSEPVKTEFGYHLIYVTNHTPAKDVSFGAVKDAVREKLVAIEMGDLINDLRDNAQVEINLQ
ncbi:peptidylprolyl isomerase [Candidatus Kuenenia sp.]|uniref:peptidylprolyl isomerase n=1 Tax=Candidatus Kuenenia sp. TaxID=2499824 RepID=UPI00321F9F6D